MDRSWHVIFVPHTVFIILRIWNFEHQSLLYYQKPIYQMILPLVYLFRNGDFAVTPRPR